LEAAARSNPNLTHFVVLDTVNPSTPTSQYPSWKTDTVVTKANKSVEKLSFMVVAANPGDLEHISACLSHDGKSVVVSSPDHSYLFQNRSDMAQVIGGGNAQECEAFIASLTRRHDRAAAHASSTADIPIPMNKTFVLLPDGVIGSNTYFNEGDDDILFTLYITFYWMSHLCALCDVFASFAHQGGLIHLIHWNLNPRCISNQSSLTKKLSLNI